MTNVQAEYSRWLENTSGQILEQLHGYSESEIQDAFYRGLAFGTGGLRGVLGAGTNRINEYTVAKATQGLANYLNAHTDAPSVVIGYDSRLMSAELAQVTADVFSANGVRAHLWPRLLPVPTVSFATRYLHASAGVMITASHNPAIYNGYKVYGPDGCQITTQAAADILSEIQKVDIFSDVRHGGPAPETISEEVLTAFIESVKAQSVLFGEPVDKDIAIVYSPLNGAGLEPVTRVLREMGFGNVTVVKEQEQPDGHFPTTPYPNPEVREAMALGMEYARRLHADLMLATDPDCDRVGIAVRDASGEYTLLSGNETGLLLLDFICSQRAKHGKMPAAPVMVKTIVTTDLGERIAASYGVETRNVLTGFKFIGEQIGLLEKQGQADRYIFGFEESYGYLSGSYVRDKDGVNAAYLICEMFAYYASRGISLPEKLSELYQKFGYSLNTLHTYEFAGEAGSVRMQEIMVAMRGTMDSIGPKKVLRVLDYAKGLDGLPKSDVLKYILSDNCSLVVRPSGTEPKLKTYISVSAKDRREAEAVEAQISQALSVFFR